MSAATTTTGFVNVEGGTLYYEAIGEGFPLVLVHSMWMNANLWDDQVTEFAQYFKVIRYDMRGFGRSRMDPVQFSDIDDLLTLFDHLNIQQAYLLGLSVGAEVAQEFTLKHPDRVRALILIGGGVRDYDQWTDELFKAEEEFMEAVRAGDYPTARDRIISIWVDGPVRPAAPHVRERIRQLLSGYTFAHYKPLPETPEEAPPLETLEESPPPISERERLAAIKVPTLVMVGDKDWPEVVDMAGLLTMYIPGSEKVVIPDAAHIVNVEQPAAFNQSVLDFLRRQAV